MPTFVTTKRDIVNTTGNYIGNKNVDGKKRNIAFLLTGFSNKVHPIDACKIVSSFDNAVLR